MERPLLSESTAAQIAVLRERAFATQLLVGETVDLVLWRDSEQDGTPVAVPAQRVVVKWASREAALRRGTATFFTGTEGEFRKLVPMDVRKADSFTLPDGRSGAITGIPITKGGVVRVAFEVQS